MWRVRHTLITRTIDKPAISLRVGHGTIPATVMRMDPFVDEALIRAIGNRAGERGDERLHRACGLALAGCEDCLAYVRYRFEDTDPYEQDIIRG